MEKDPALPGFGILRPSGWTMEERTIKQNLWSDYGKTLRFSKGNLSIEVGLEPIDKSKTKLSDFGNPGDFAKVFANSAARIAAAPNPGDPSPIPKITPLKMDAAQDLKRFLAQYRLEVGERVPLLFEQLFGLGSDSEKKNYLYSITAMSPESEFDINKELFADCLKSFKMLNQ